MLLPSKIKVAGFDVPIKEWPTEHADDNGAFGDFKTNPLGIRIDISVNRFKVVDTLLHEINHAIYWAYNIQDEDKEERICGTFATAWLQVYRDNHNLLEWIKFMIQKG